MTGMTRNQSPALEIRQFRYGSDNLGYLICGRASAMAVDGGDPVGILQSLTSTGLELRYVANTHTHADHTGGNNQLLRKTEADRLEFADLLRKGGIELDGQTIDVIHTPGHTSDSVCFYTGGSLLSGDTLFNGKVGRCFTGDSEGFYHSIRKLLELPEDTLVCAGHDYVHEYMEFARSIEPGNASIDTYLQAYDPDNLCYTLEEEMAVDPFLRLESEELIRTLRAKGLPADSEYDRWRSLLSIM